MKVLIDANVLYPTVMREVVLGVAAAGLFEPQWSDRILEEWARAAARLGTEGETQARGEIVMLGARWPRANVTYPPELENRLWLPDPADVHVLAAAISGSADIILTSNAKDFPRNILAEEGVARADPDGFLLGCFEAQPEAVSRAAESVLTEARRLSGEDWQMRGLMKKARLPRFGKAIERFA
ncbi:PIN domain-containing protein [Tateyamaria omphalii]|uniref:RSP_2648 family PIN domain-containing protein n=1 Tax=Tateyamaria omphalii TaxID=299262 RepID=UPI00167884D6|nr:PIN domain-containing protein [Tateyamaria omphalii]GGX46723.1 PIN domain-containing protein [Tateyamaria omphalii]